MPPEAEILTDDSLWAAVLGACQCDLLDVFHLYAYVALEAARLGGWPILLHLRHAGTGFAMPLILRAIPGQDTLCDATSVYGYNGCIGNGPLDDLTRRQIAESFARALAKAGCVSVFNRGHPFLPPVIPDAMRIGTTFYVDLAAGEAAYEQHLSHGHAYSLRKMRDADIRVEHDRELRHLAAFHRIYGQTMDRRGASAGYYFEEGYLRQLLGRPELGGELHHAWSGDELVAGCVFLRHGRAAHYHLSASARGASKHPATKLILDTFIRSEIRSGRSHRLHLGGGIGGADDTLAEFKRGFAGKPVPYYQTRWIIRPDDYARLSHGKADNGFFPLYRCPA